MKKKLIALSITLASLLSVFPVLAMRNGPAGKSNKAHLYLYEKDPTTWEIVEGGAWGKMTYDLSGEEFSYVFNGHELEQKTEYTLLYYPDPWPGTGLICLGTEYSNNGGNINIGGSVNTGNLPADYDDNPGAKIWLVISSDVNCEDDTSMTGWNPTEYLFEYDLITFDDTGDPDVEPAVVYDTSSCTTIQDGELFASDGNEITTGYDQWGYNYQAHMYSGYLGNYQRPDTLVSDGDWLMMKWNDAWLSNKDCDDDGSLDRYYGYPSYIGSGAWLTNHQSGDYEDDGQTCSFNYFVKIVAVPSDAYKVDGFWYADDYIEIGPVIWGAFAIVQEVLTDPCEGAQGVQYISPDHPGLGGWQSLAG